MSHEHFIKLEERIKADYGNIAGLVLLQDGNTLYEQYFNGCAAGKPVHVFSVTKSVVSLLFGIALDKGLIQSVKQKALDFFPDYTIKRGEKTIQTITIENLLTMTAPFKFKSAPYTKVYSCTDWVKASLDLLGGKKPVGEFVYRPLIGPDILSGILRKATGRSVLNFAQEYLFSPLGINVPSDIVLYTQEEHIAFVKTSNRGGWVADEAGNNTAGWGLTLTAMDMAKIGQLCLNAGTWNGKQIVPAEWIKDSTSEHSRWKEENMPYGYLWWTGIGNGYAAIGDSGNIIYINPAKKIVCAIASLFKPTAKDRIEFITRFIDPL